jgi:predicted RecA/RadA family phage recombinase
MKNAYQDGRVIDVTLTAAVASGGVVIKDRLFGVAVVAGTPGDVVPCHVEGVFSLPKLSTDVIGEGQAVIWRVNPGHAVPFSSALVGDIENVGYAVAAAGNPSTEVLVRLCPSPSLRRIP